MPFIELRAELAPLRPAIDAAIARVLDAGAFIGGPEVDGFERALAAVVGARRAVGTSSGTDALLAILMALDVGPGAEVVTTPLTFFATTGAIARLGARPVFVDVDDELGLDPAAAAAACTARTRAIIPVHLYGGLARMTSYWPLSIVEHGAALNITLISYAGELGFGLIAARNAVPDLAPIAQGLLDAFEELERRTPPAEPVAPRRSAASRRSSKNEPKPSARAPDKVQYDVAPAPKAASARGRASARRPLPATR